LAHLSSDLSALRRVNDQVRLAGECRAPVLIIGEPGSGKQTVARTIHHQSSLPGTFVAVDCARLPAVALAVFVSGRPGTERGLNVRTRYLKEPQCLPRDLQARLQDSLHEENE